ncbi:S8 family serine peptidase [Intrasporangium sp.]|uniref:S8 family serine peptidase n=1 Tax=Intrasporangium sp. TaxID=1925024 RepID=UPI00293B70E1|nr:S8 family serine peptidase [Intrasporangium sp.]MDV3221008.1 S8 family serine peptidase [Intrasporangium sp.]
MAQAAEPDPTTKFTAAAEQELATHKTADFWVRMADKADLSAASAIKDWNKRGEAVYDTLRKTAQNSQTKVVAQLSAASADFTPYWITNAVLVRGGDLDLAKSLAANAEVKEIRETTVFELIKPVEQKPDTNRNAPTAVEWGISAINADDVWAQGITGQGITVANIDTGVDLNHPALRPTYRGLLPGGGVDNNYNFYDTTGNCNAAADPCDDNGHGTHTMGTMIGADGANEIGVAPDAKWIAANGCDTCADADLIESGQWMLAPTMTDGSNPDTSKRPNIINNSWGSRTPSTAPFMEDIIEAWDAAGIWSQWSNGNSGPSCQSSGSPGSRTITYSAGAFDQSGAIADFSARGPGQDGTIKPNIAAPGVSVRSSLPGGGYGFGSGTSMSSPHVAGAVALLWSAAPSLVGDMAATRALLNETAIDTSDLTCGGTPENNNVWGEGKLDAQALIAAAPVGDVGRLAGTVTADGAPVAGARVDITGPTTRSLTTSEDGTFDVAVTAGDYSLTVNAFGYLEATQTATVTAGATTTVPVALSPAPRHTVSGTVTLEATGAPVEGATVTIATQLPSATTGADGTFSIADVPEGRYILNVDAGGCAAPHSGELVVDGDETVTVVLEGRADGYGYTCVVGTDGYLQGTTETTLTGDDATLAVDLPWEFPFYGESYSTAYLSTNGHLNFLARVSAFSNASIPRTAAPNAAIYPFWDDLRVDDASGVYTGTTTVNGVDAFVVEWRNVRLFSDADARTNFSVALLRNGRVLLGYGDQTEGKPLLTGTSATVGIENADGTIAWQYSFNTAAVTPGMAITFAPPPSGVLSGTVTDYNDQLPIAGAKVTIQPSSGDPITVTTDADGTYSRVLFLDTYQVEVSATNYVSESTEVVFDEDGDTATFSPALRTGIAEITAEPSYDWGVLGAGDTREATFTVTNTGSAPLEFSVAESGRRTTTAVTRPAALSGAAVKSATAEDRDAMSAKGLYSRSQVAAQKSLAVPSADGDVIASWPTGLTIPWGVGYDGDVWISDPDSVTNNRFTTDGSLQATYSGAWGGVWNGDMALDTRTGDICQVNVGGDNAIVCFDPATGTETDRISGSPWNGISQRGLAYNAADDVFYIGGWNEGILYTVAGTTHPTPGQTLATCEPAEPGIAGLAYNGTSDTVWMVPSVQSTVFYQLSPEDCSTLKTVAYPTADEFPGSGLEVDEAGNLWTANQVDGRAYLVDVGDPQDTDVPWLSVDPTTATIGVGETETFTITVDASLGEPGVWQAAMRLNTGAGRVRTVSVPMSLVISAYQVGVNAGGEALDATDLFRWQADQAHADGSWGYVGTGTKSETTKKAIAGTPDPSLFQSRRVGGVTYQFDDAPAGTYQIELGFSEWTNTKAGKRVFDVKVNGAYAIVGKDIITEVPILTADLDTVVVEHGGGDLTIELAPRKAMDSPIINTLKVQERADL